MAVARAYLDGLGATAPGLRIGTIDRWEEDLPPFDGHRSNAKVAMITLLIHRAMRWPVPV